MEHIQQSDESRVLVINTGGTIGICQSRFHDPLEDSLFSHSGSIEGFRKWSSRSGRSSPVSDFYVSASQEAHTLLVRSTRPVTPSLLLPTNQQKLAEYLVGQCEKTEDGVYECLLPSLVTPRMSIHAGNTALKRIRYVVLEWNPLLDSSNVETEDWVRIATEIELNYAAFDAFVVLHGTDTMSYTSSALSFMLEDLGKTVILTGAQIPLSELRNDAVDNLLGALAIAGHYIIPECCLFFNQCLYRGNRVSKISSYDLDAFNSPNFPPLVNVGIDITVNWTSVLRQSSLRRFKAHKNMNSHVVALRLFPGISSDTVRAFMMPPVRGVVLETFGAGNAPQRSDLMKALQEASIRGVVIVAITQCSKGTVSDAYEAGRTLLNAGVVPGGDMTPECALTKLRYLLSKPELSVEKVRELIRLSLRGELTPAGRSSAKLSMSQHLDLMHDFFAQMVRLSSAPLGTATAPEIGISLAHECITDKSAAPWSWTAGEASATESSLLPILIRLAVAKDDVEGLNFCLHFQDDKSTPQSLGDANLKLDGGCAAGVVNSVDPSSGWTPLHIAAFNGSNQCLHILLQEGALVHYRDTLGHTALYYAARRGHTEAVNILRQAGANLGGSDIEGGYARLEVTKATQWGDECTLQTWQKAGF
ncbi:hypothetical protein M0805_005966 [Coniferiporia weirii]|nr:hypothetical protein M0805_005966 [Coniferiporia weirii]